MAVVDLKAPCAISYPCATCEEDSRYVFWSTGIQSDYQPPTYAPLSQMCQTVPWKLQGKALHLSRSVPLYGFRSADLSRKPQRYRGMSPSPTKQTLSYGHTRQHRSQYFGQCEPGSRLEDLRRFCPTTDPESQITLCVRTPFGRSEPISLRSGFNHHRSLSIYLPLGKVSSNQICCKDAHPIGSKGQYSNIYPCDRWKNPRCSNPRPTDSRSRIVLRYGQGLSGLRKALYTQPVHCILCYKGQSEFAVQKIVFASSGQKHRTTMRSNYTTDGSFVITEVPRQIAPNKVIGFQKQHNNGVSDQ